MGIEDLKNRVGKYYDYVVMFLAFVSSENTDCSIISSTFRHLQKFSK